MNERPMLFNGDMVRAILSGRKTRTRRPMKVQPPENWGGTSARFAMAAHCPHGVRGDRIWVRETFWVQNDTCDHDYCSGCDMGSMLSLGPDYCCPDYVATPSCYQPPKCEYEQTVEAYTGEPCPGYWWLAPPGDWDGEDDEAHLKRGEWGWIPYTFYTKHPSIHMPRWACRIVLEITDVRVQRVQEISALDALNEGINTSWEAGTDVDIEGDLWPAGERKAIKMFSALWDSCYGKTEFAWDKNPWVWALTFKRVEGGGK